MIDDRCQLQIKPVPDDFRQRFSIKLHRFLIAHGFQLIIGTGNFRIVRFPFFRQRFNDLALLRHPAGIRDDDFLRFFFRQIAEFLQHFLCRPKIYRRMGFYFPRFLPVGQKDIPVPRVFGKKVVGIRCGAYGNPRFFSYFNNFLVQLLQIFFRRDGSILIFIQQEFIVSQRLHFQIIIEFRQTDQFFIAVSVQNGTEKFTHDTGGTIHQSVPEFLKERTGQKRTLAVVFQMGQRHKTVQIAEPRDIFCQQDNMAVLLPVTVNIFRHFIDQITFHAVDDFLPVFCRQCLYLGKCLNDAVIRNRHGRMLPLCRRPDDLFIIDESVQTHFRMEMEFYTRYFSHILMVDFFLFPLFHLGNIQHKAAGKFIKLHIPPDFYGHILFYTGQLLCVFLLFKKLFAKDSVCLISQLHGKQTPVFTEISALTVNDSSLYDDTALFFPDRTDIRYFPFNM